MGSVGQAACFTGLNRVVRVGLMVEEIFEEGLESKRKQCRYFG